MLVNRRSSGNAYVSPNRFTESACITVYQPYCLLSAAILDSIFQAFHENILFCTGSWLLNASVKYHKREINQEIKPSRGIALSSGTYAFKACIRVCVLCETGEAGSCTCRGSPKQFLFLKIAAALPTWTRGKKHCHPRHVFKWKSEDEGETERKRTTSALLN